MDDYGWAFSTKSRIAGSFLGTLGYTHLSNRYPLLEKTDVHPHRRPLVGPGRRHRNIDWNVGRILKKLDALQLTERTIVIFFSDNGPNSWRWNDGMRGRKGSTDEGGLRVPFFIRWPDGIEPGTRISEIAGAIDLLPTLSERYSSEATVSSHAGQFSR